MICVAETVSALVAIAAIVTVTVIVAIVVVAAAFAVGVFAANPAIIVLATVVTNTFKAFIASGIAIVAAASITLTFIKRSPKF